MGRCQAGSSNRGGKRGGQSNNNIRRRGTPLTKKHKDKINGFKKLATDDEIAFGVIGSDLWKRNLCQYMFERDDAVTPADIERWIKKYDWITSEARRTSRPHAGIPIIHRLEDSSSPSEPVLTPELAIPPQVNGQVKMPSHNNDFGSEPDPQYPPQHPDSRFYDPQHGDLPFHPNLGHFHHQSFGPPMGQFLPPPPPLPMDLDFQIQRQYQEIQNIIWLLNKSFIELPELRQFLIPLATISNGVRRNHKNLLAPNHGEIFQRFVLGEVERAKMVNEGQQDLDYASSSRVIMEQQLAENTQQVIDFGEYGQ